MTHTTDISYRTVHDTHNWYIITYSTRHTQTDILYRTIHDTHNWFIITYSTWHTQLIYYNVQYTTHTNWHIIPYDTRHTQTDILYRTIHDTHNWAPHKTIKYYKQQLWLKESKNMLIITTVDTTVCKMATCFKLSCAVIRPTKMKRKT
jgi:hypothetical protein